MFSAAPTQCTALVWSGFQIIGTDPSVTSASGVANGILLGSVLIAIATVISAVGVRFTAVINGIGVSCEIIGVVLLLVLLFSHAERGPGVVTHTLNVSGNSPYIYAFLASTLMAAYVMYGFDSAAELGDEPAAAGGSVGDLAGAARVVRRRWLHDRGRADGGAVID